MDTFLAILSNRFFFGKVNFLGTIESQKGAKIAVNVFAMLGLGLKVDLKIYISSYKLICFLIPKAKTPI